MSKVMRKIAGIVLCPLALFGISFQPPPLVPPGRKPTEGHGGHGNVEVVQPNINSQLIEKKVNEYLDIDKEWTELGVAIISLLDKHKDKKELEEVRKHVEKLEEHRKAIIEKWFKNSVLLRSHVQSLPSDFGNTPWQSQ